MTTTIQTYCSECREWAACVTVKSDPTGTLRICLSCLPRCVVDHVARTTEWRERMLTSGLRTRPYIDEPRLATSIGDLTELNVSSAIIAVGA